MPQVSDEIKFIVPILGIAIFILVALLVATFAMLRSGAQTRKERSSTSLAENTSAPIPKDKLNEESIVASRASEVVIPAPEDGQKNTFKINQRTINLLGVPITVVLMMGLMLVLVLVNPTDKVYLDMALEPWLWSILRIFVGIAGGGAIGIRTAHLSWQQTVLTALLAGAGAMLISQFEISPFEIPPFNFGPWESSDGNFHFTHFLTGALAVSSPVFVLPLCDPILRKNGLAPSRKKVLSVAFFITLIFAPLAQIAVGVFTVFTGLLLGLGVILSLYRPMDSIGAEFGGLGFILVLTSSFVWLAYISGSFN